MRKRVFFIQADLETEAKKLFHDTLRLPVSITGLVNNASEFTAGDLTDAAHFRRVTGINALAPHILALEFFRMVKTGWIINITDAHVRPLNRTFQNYRISKLLLTELTRQEAFTFAPHIRVNAIAPGPVLPPEGRSGAKFDNAVGNTPLKHAVHISCILKAYTYLVENCCVTGETLNVDSGWHIES
jgi:NAD(P)-dependent dehydrogenase (short-subunit alcohol dehydrogenase family)